MALNQTNLRRLSGAVRPGAVRVLKTPVLHCTKRQPESRFLFWKRHELFAPDWSARTHPDLICTHPRLFFFKAIYLRKKWPVGRLARAAVGVGRVGVVRRAYRSSMKIPKVHCGNFFFFNRLLNGGKNSRNQLIFTWTDCDGGHANFGPRFFASACFVRIFICLQRKLKKCFCGGRKMHYSESRIIVNTVYCLYV